MVREARPRGGFFGFGFGFRIVNSFGLRICLCVLLFNCIRKRRLKRFFGNDRGKGPYSSEKEELVISWSL